MEELFDKCLKQAMKMGRKHMISVYDDKPTEQEWQLALVLFRHELNLEEKE